MVSKVNKIGTVIAIAIAVVTGIWFIGSSYMVGSTDANKLEILDECLRSGGNETAVVDGLVLSRAFPDTMLNEDQLRTEWQSYPNLYVQDCNYRADLTPQEVEELGK